LPTKHAFHGWPGSVLEEIKLIGPLTDPTAYGGKADDAFDVVIPSMAGYGFSKRRGPQANPSELLPDHKGDQKLSD
jgi:hypothetical protein